MLECYFFVSIKRVPEKHSDSGGHACQREWGSENELAVKPMLAAILLADEGQLLHFRQLIPKSRRLLKLQVFGVFEHLRFELL